MDKYSKIGINKHVYTTVFFLAHVVQWLNIFILIVFLEDRDVEKSYGTICISFRCISL